MRFTPPPHSCCASRAGRERPISRALTAAFLVAFAVISIGCSEQSASTAPAPAPPPAAAPAAPTPGAPADLRVSATGVDFIEVSWSAVEGATGYEAQLSLTAADFTSVTAANVTGTTHRFTVAAETTGHVRVRATSAGTRSDWSEAVSGTSLAAPLVLGAPMPRVSDTGTDFIEWSWEAVPEALAYEVQVSDSEDFSSAEAVRVTETSHRAAVEPSTTAHLRVRAVAGTSAAPIVSDWSAAAEGSSAAAEIAFTVSLRPPAAKDDRACGGQAFCPDEGSDLETATAAMNQRMIVTTSTPAEVRPLFVEGAAAITASAGESSPFGYIRWPAPQKTVAMEGVSFALRRVSMGAGQEPTPTGDTLYITCGPFRCSEASDETPPAPPITISDSAACSGFEPDFTLNPGMALNNNPNQNNGLDAGWTYTSTAPGTVTHVFEGIPGSNGGPFRVKGAAIRATSTPAPLDMSRNDATGVNVFGGTLDNAWTSTGFGVQNLQVTTAGPIRNGEDDCFFESEDAFGDHKTTSGGWHANAWRAEWGSYDLVGREVRKPEECFRIITYDTENCSGNRCENDNPSRADYLQGYSIEVQPEAAVTWAGSAVDWSKVKGSFAELECEPVTISASAQVDMCDLFEEEVDLYWGQGRVADLDGRPGSAEFKVRPVVLFGRGEVPGSHRLVELKVTRNMGPGDYLNARDADATDPNSGFHRPRGSRFMSLWLAEFGPRQTGTWIEANHEARNVGIDGTPWDSNLYYSSGNHAWEFLVHGRWYGHPSGQWTAWPQDGLTPPVPQAQHNQWQFQRGIVVFPMQDHDAHPIHGDFGKVDINGDGKADNMGDGADRNCSDADGPGCDVDELELDGEATFSLYKNSEDLACHVTREVSITCSWDASGDGNRSGRGEIWANWRQARTRDDRTTNAGDFIRCRGN